MKALVVVDTQEVIVNHGSFDKELNNIQKMIKAFRDQGDMVLFTQHVEDNPEGFFYEKNDNVKIVDGLIAENEMILKKKTPSIFKDTDLTDTLKKKGIEHLYLVGFNTEFCCMFSAIAAFDRGFKVTVIEDALGTVNNEEVYEMPGLDINDFVGTVLSWSNVVEVLYTEEYFEE